jgi:tetrahydrodipicolinate N-succinyltransferase
MEVSVGDDVAVGERSSAGVGLGDGKALAGGVAVVGAGVGGDAAQAIRKAQTSVTPIA